MSRIRGAALLLVYAVTVVAVSSGCASETSQPDPAGVTESDTVVTGEAGGPDYAWSLDGGGQPAAGETELVFSGGHSFTGGAAAFDGATGFAASEAPGPVATTESFTVTAWVSLGPSPIGGSAEYATAASQLGDEAAAFYLGVAEGSWAFSMKDADTNDPGHTIRAQSGVAAPDPDTWVHLAGVHDVSAGQIRLYLDGELAATAPFSEPWQAQGPLTIGRSQAHATASDFWAGAVTDVRVYHSVVTDQDIRSLVDETRPASSPPAMPTTAPKTALPEGTYRYVYSADEAARIVGLFTPEDLAAAGYSKRSVVAAELTFRNGQWQQGFSFDGEPYTVGGVPEGDGGTFTIDRDRLVTSNGEIEVTYRWSFEDGVLSLSVLEDSAGEEDAAIVRLITEHPFSRTGRSDR
jgi:Concanavalin A-like lectin/glucanases superfamily